MNKSNLLSTIISASIFNALIIFGGIIFYKLIEIISETFHIGMVSSAFIFYVLTVISLTCFDRITNVDI